MANVKFRTISDGTTIAYALDSLSVNNNKIRMFSSLDNSFYSEAELPDGNDAVSEPVDGVIDADLYITDKTNCTTALQNLIDDTYSAGGGVIRLGVGVYKVSQLSLSPKVHLQGQGVGQTVLARIPNSSNLESATDALHGLKGFINLSTQEYACSISDISLYGGSTYTANGNNPYNMVYTDSVPENGIFLCDNTMNALTSTGSAADAYDAITSDKLLTNGGNRTQKFITIQNVSIFGFYGSGIYIGTYNTDVIVDNVFISHCRYDGIANNGNKNNISNVHLFANGLCGIYDGGHGNKYNNITSESNGRYGHTTSAGIYLKDSTGCMVNNALVKNCYSKGYIISGNNNMVMNCVSDANSGASNLDSTISVNNTNPKDLPHVLLAGNNHQININIMNSKKSTTSPIAKYTVFTASGASISNCIINIIADGANTSESGALINAIAISSVNNSQIISGNNVLTYIP